MYLFNMTSMFFKKRLVECDEIKAYINVCASPVMLVQSSGIHIVEKDIRIEIIIIKKR